LRRQVDAPPGAQPHMTGWNLKLEYLPPTGISYRFMVKAWPDQPGGVEPFTFIHCGNPGHQYYALMGAKFYLEMNGASSVRIHGKYARIKMPPEIRLEQLREALG